MEFVAGVLVLVPIALILVLSAVLIADAIRWFTSFFKKRASRHPLPRRPPRLPQRAAASTKPARRKKPARRPAPQETPSPSAKAPPRPAPVPRPVLPAAPVSNGDSPQRREERHRALARSWITREDPSQPPKAPISWRRTIITGKAFVIDGDTIRVARRTIRLSGLDAPELDQVAKHEHGYWYDQGQRVKSELIRVLGGKHVKVVVEGTDKYGRVLGTVLYENKDVGEWLVRKGYAIAAYGEQYKHVEAEARRARRGMWGHTEMYDPRAWRHRE